MKELKILGTGCSKCQKLADTVEAAAKALGIEYQIEKVQELNEIMKFGVMVTPALAVDGEIKVVGKVPTLDETKALLG